MLEQCRAMMEHMSAAMSGSGSASWMPGMMPMGGAMGMTMPFLGLLWVTLLVSIGLGLGWLLFRGGNRQAGEGARDVLDTRYARGELDRDSYLRMRADLAERAPTTR